MVIHYVKQYITNTVQSNKVKYTAILVLARQLFQSTTNTGNTTIEIRVKNGCFLMSLPHFLPNNSLKIETKILIVIN